MAGPAATGPSFLGKIFTLKNVFTAALLSATVLSGGAALAAGFNAAVASGAGANAVGIGSALAQAPGALITGTGHMGWASAGLPIENTWNWALGKVVEVSGVNVAGAAGAACPVLAT